MEYFKATRLDGTDQRTGTVKYEVGKRTVHPTSKMPIEDKPATYLSVSTVATDCTGFRWPCRLFKVEGVGKAMTSSFYKNKRGFLQVDVVEEVEAWQVFGKQGKAVVGVIERAGRLTVEECRELRQEHRAAAYAADVAADAATYAADVAAAVAAAADAAYAADAAVRALVTWDLATVDGPYTIKQRDLLIKPWATVIGMPEIVED